MNAIWLADVLRAAGLKVVEHDGWKQRGHGHFSNLRAVVWHHDASPAGPSPGIPGFMLSNWTKASANCWVALDGTWHLLAAGVSYHAGRVLPGKPDNDDSLGIETDHTTGEPWSGVVLLDSLRRGTAAILAHINSSPSKGLEFHKTICSPVGRKNDPDGLDIVTERIAVARLIHPTQEDDMFTDADRQLLKEVRAALLTGAPAVGIPAIRDAVTDLAYDSACIDRPGKPSRRRRLFAKLGVQP